MMVTEFFGLFFDPNQDPSNFRFIKAGNIHVQNGTRQSTSGCYSFIARTLKLKRKLTCFLTQEGLVFWEIPKSGQAYANMTTRLYDMKSFDNHIDITSGKRETGYTHGIKIKTGHSKITLIASDFFEFVDWLYIIIDQVSKNIYCKKTRFRSYAPERIGNLSKWFIDTEGYYEAIYNACMSAKSDIFICDWWLHPKIYLKRPLNKENEGSRIDNLLHAAVQRGVHVKVLMYHESKLGCGNDSAYTKEVLNAIKNENDPTGRYIEVLRHPPSSFFPWSHHEKMVIVDGKIGFLGGIDICLGRYEHETPRYLLYEPVEMKKVMDLKSADDEMPMVGKVEISPDFMSALQGEENDWITRAQNTDDGSNRKWHGKDQVSILFLNFSERCQQDSWVIQIKTTAGFGTAKITTTACAPNIRMSATGKRPCQRTNAMKSQECPAATFPW
jgi:hypothetical protein